VNEIVPTDGSPANEIDIFANGSNIFDVQRFEMVSKVADVMAKASLIPDHLKVKKGDSIDYEGTFANCFVISNLSLTWGFDPFMVAQAASLTYGKITLEGKLVRAVIRKYLKFDFSYQFFGNSGDMGRRCYVSDRALLDANGNPLDEPAIIALINRGERITAGTLQKWHTKNKNGGVNDNWAKDEDKMFRERGAREWCRQWAPGLILGVYTPDEFDEQSENYRAANARNITPQAQTAANPLLDDKSPQRKSMPMDKIDATTGEIIEPQRQQKSSPRSTASQAHGDEKAESQTSRLSADKFRDYGKALVRCVNADNLKPTHDAFWNGSAPAAGPDYDLARAIYGVHADRLKGGTDAQSAVAAVTSLIERDFPL
jgi:RecT family